LASLRLCVKVSPRRCRLPFSATRCKLTQVFVKTFPASKPASIAGTTKKIEYEESISREFQVVYSVVRDTFARADAVSADRRNAFGYHLRRVVAISGSEGRIDG